MNWFEAIDDRLKHFAGSYGAEIVTKGSMIGFGGLYAPPEKIQERKILWIDGGIGKGILITPYFVSIDFDSPMWDFENMAWLEDGKPYPHGKPFWIKSLLENVRFQEIE